MSTSSQQIAANQENAQYSTGPRTEEGKKIVSLNALRHGLTSQLVVLPNEDHERYGKFETELSRDLKAEGPAEVMLAETICDTQWRIARGRATESAILARGHMEPQPDYIVDLEIRDVQTAMVEASSWENHEKVLRNIHIQEARLHRILFKTMQELRDLQARRKQEAQEQIDDAIAALTYHKQNNLTFTPSEFGFVFTTSEIKQAVIRKQWRKSMK